MKRLIVLLTVAAVVAAIPMSSASARGPRSQVHQETKKVRAIKTEIQEHFSRINALVERMTEVATSRQLRHRRGAMKRLSAKISQHTRAIASLQQHLVVAARRAERNTILKARNNALPARSRHAYKDVSRKEMVSLLRMLRKASFDDQRLALVVDVVTGGHRMSATQAAKVLKTFDFDRNRVDAAEMLCKAVSEPALHVLASEMDFQSNRRTLRSRTGGQCGVPDGRLAMGR
jgi:hypothetical protein